MKMRTIHNRVERREYTFSRGDLLTALKEAIARRLTSLKPTDATAEEWELDYDVDNETGILSNVIVTQSFEYLTPAVESYEAADAVARTDGEVTG